MYLGQAFSFETGHFWPVSNGPSSCGLYGATGHNLSGQPIAAKQQTGVASMGRYIALIY